jgi:hypothetical protein
LTSNALTVVPRYWMSTTMRIDIASPTYSYTCFVFHVPVRIRSHLMRVSIPCPCQFPGLFQVPSHAHASSAHCLFIRAMICIFACTKCTTSDVKLCQYFSSNTIQSPGRGVGLNPHHMRCTKNVKRGTFFVGHFGRQNLMFRSRAFLSRPILRGAFSSSFLG